MGTMGISPVSTGYGESYNGYAANRTGLRGDETGDTGDASDSLVLNQGESTKKAPGRKSSPAECQTCKERKYQDGSDEMVSFKTPGHIDPDNAQSVVMGHEQEHVANAYKKAAENNGEVVQASVRLKTAVCPECGRTYVSGGETNTQIRYYNEQNPYQQTMKQSDAIIVNLQKFLFAGFEGLATLGVTIQKMSE